MSEATKTVDPDDIWDTHGKAGTGCPGCARLTSALASANAAREEMRLQLIALLNAAADELPTHRARTERLESLESRLKEAEAALGELLIELDGLKGAPWLGKGLALSNIMTAARALVLPHTEGKKE